MKNYIKPLVACVIISTGISACSNNDNKKNTINQATNKLNIQCVTNNIAEADTAKTQLAISVVDTYVSGNAFDTASAEIVSYDSCSDKLYVVNAKDKTIDVLALNTTSSAPSLSSTINLQAAAQDAGISIGSANSVVAKKGLVAVAIEAATKQDNGIIALYRSDDLSLLATYTAGALPDMVAMTDDGRYILSANEGEPNGQYTVDPEGSVTLIDLAKGVEKNNAIVKQITFSEFNSGASRASEMPADVRLAGPSGTSVAQDLEPEYIAIMESTGKAIVSMQENNAVAIIDIKTAAIDGFKGLGVKSWSTAKLDVTNKDKTYSTASYDQLVGYYMPDTITSVTINGKDYFLSANEGDGREYIYETTQASCVANSHEWDGKDLTGTPEYTTKKDDCISFTDEGRGKDLTVASNHPLMMGGNDISDKNALGRIKVIIDNKNIAAGDNVHTFGARSFSIWDATGNLVWDSGDQLSTKAYKSDNANWNTTNDNNNSSDDRSDDKGVEPEALEVATINGETFAFIGLERQGGIFVYNISNPQAPTFVDYKNNRDFSADVCTVVDDGDCDNDTYNQSAGDLGPESIEYFSRAGKHFIAVGNEVSGTTTVYALTMSSPKAP